MMQFLYSFAGVVLVTSVIIALESPDVEPGQLQLAGNNETNKESYIFGLEVLYVINNNCTNSGNILAVQIVTSSAGNVKARSALRRAYPQNELQEMGIYRVFLLAMLRPDDTSKVNQTTILDENEEFNDIVQGNFYDHYRNLTYKNTMGIRWAVTQCQAPLVIKMDDDTVVDMYSLIPILDANLNSSFDLLGCIHNSKPQRRKGYRWYVTKEEFEPDKYPPYLFGLFYVIKYNAAKKLLSASKSERFFWVDDVLLTGVLTQKANLSLGELSHYLTFHQEVIKCCIEDKVECGYIIVAECRKNYDLNFDFKVHSKSCHEMSCPKYTDRDKFEQSCMNRTRNLIIFIILFLFLFILYIFILMKHLHIYRVV